MKKFNTPFDPLILHNVSPNYRFMDEDITNRVPELYSDVRFSKSDVYRSIKFINYSCYKPISNVFFQELKKVRNDI